MNILWYYLIGFIVIWVIAYLFKDKSFINIEGLVIMLKTDKFKSIIDKIANISPRFWKYFTNLLIPIGFVVIVLMVVSLIWSLNMMFDQPTVSLILPGVDIPGSPLYIPFISGLIALAIVVIVHEGGHGILARVENINLDSVGLLLFTIIPGAFVELNQKELDKANGMSKIRIYFAGPLANIVLCIIALVIVASIGGFIASEDIYVSDGMEITSVVPSSPSEGILENGMVIKQINNQTVTNTNQYTQVLNNTKIGDRLNITTTTNSYNIVMTSNPSNSTKSYMGIRAKEHKIVSPSAEKKYGNIIPEILLTLEEFFNLIFLLNLAVGTFNLVPMKPLDGGLIFEEIVRMNIRPDRRKEFNDTLNRYTKKLPMSVRCWLSRRLNNLLNFIEAHHLTEENAGVVVRIVSTFFMVIIIMLVLYGVVPGILKLI